MPNYYGVMIHDNGDTALAAFGQAVPQQLGIPNREPDFPHIVLPFAEESRIDAFNRLFPEWVERSERPALIRANDDGTIDAWLLEEAELGE